MTEVQTELRDAVLTAQRPGYKLAPFGFLRKRVPFATYLEPDKRQLFTNYAVLASVAEQAIPQR